MLGGMLRGRPIVCGPCAAGPALPRSSNSVIMSWSSWIRLWQCTTYLPSTGAWSGPGRRAGRDEAHEQLDALVRSHVDDVLQAGLVGERRPAVAADDQEVHDVDVDRMETPTGRVVEDPPLGDFRPDGGDHAVVPGESVDDPETPTALEPEPARGDDVTRTGEVEPGQLEGTLKRGTSVFVPTTNLMTSRIWSSAAVFGSVTDRPASTEKSMTTSYRSAMRCRHDVTGRLLGRNPASPAMTVNGIPLLTVKLKPRDAVETSIGKRYMVGSTRMNGHGTPLTSITLPGGCRAGGRRRTGGPAG